MRMRWKVAAMILAVLAAAGGCMRNTTGLSAAASRPHLDGDVTIIEWPDSMELPPDTIWGDTGYYGSGHRYIPPDEGDTTGLGG